MMQPEPTAKVVFTPSGRRGTFRLGMPLLEAARTLGVDIDSVCGGPEAGGLSQSGRAPAGALE